MRSQIMANTYTSLHYHIVFGTKNREPWITPDIEQRIWAYLGGIARENGATPVKIGGVEDHVHIILGMPATLAPSKAVQLLKGGSSKWVHDTFPALAGFGWQDGYGAFTVSKSNLPEVIQYVEGQREHHRAKTFQEEYRAFLDKCGVGYDERYLWG
jgi:REP element-mobilizing transposase RayT